MNGQAGSSETRGCAAAFAAGFVTFSLLYSPQPILHLLGDHFQVGPHSSALVIALPTLFLSLSSILPLLLGGAAAGWIVPGAIIGASAISLAAFLSPNWDLLIVGRGLAGVLLGLVPASVMASLAAGVAPERMGRAMAWYVAGTGAGGLLGRVMTSALAQPFGFQAALISVCSVSLLVGIVLWLSFPEERTTTVRSRWPASMDGPGIAAALTARSVQAVSLIGFLLMSSFVSIFNYLSFLLASPKFGLSQATLTLSFLPLATGIFTVPLFGRLFDQLGPRRMLTFAFGIMVIGALLTLSSSLIVLVTGVTCVAFGAYAGQSFRGRNACAPTSLECHLRVQRLHVLLLSRLSRFGLRKRTSLRDRGMAFCCRLHGRNGCAGNARDGFLSSVAG